MQNVVMAILGTIFILVGGYQATPTIMKYIQTKKADNLVEKEKAIADAIGKYVAINGSLPTDLNTLVTNGYISENTINDNGWGENITLDIDDTNTSGTGMFKLKTTIPNSDGKIAFLSNWKSWITPIDVNGTITNTFMISNNAQKGQSVGSLSGAIISSTAPLASSAKFWYDTNNSGFPILKISDGVTWKPMTVATTTTSSGGGFPNITTSNTYSSYNNLPSSGVSVGEIKYVRNDVANTIDTYIYYDSGWSLYRSNTTSGVVSTVTSFTPNTTEVGLSTSFNIVGTKLPATLSFSVADGTCEILNLLSQTNATINCTFSSTGNKVVDIRKTVGGTLIYTGNVLVTLPPINPYLSIPSYLGMLETGQTTSSSNGDDGFYERGLGRNFVSGVGTITDTATGLMWEDRIQQTNSTQSDRAAAINYCNNLVHAGYTDWTLPEYGQLLTIVNYGATTSPKKYPHFTYVQSDYYFTNTYVYYGSTYSETLINFSDGLSTHGGAATNKYVRCVRSAN